MRLPLQITFHNLEPSEFIEKAAREHAEKLEQFHDQIISCRVSIEAPHKHQNKGILYHVTIDIRVPGDEIVVSRMPDDEHAHEDVYVAMRDAFNAARRQLKQYVQKRRGQVKRHAAPPPVSE